MPPELHRFRSYGARYKDGHDKASVCELLRGRIAFAYIADFNDPFECRPYLRPAFENVGEQRLAIEKYVRGIYVERGHSIGDATKRAKRFLAGKTPGEILKFAGERLLKFADPGGVLTCCLSGPEALGNPLPWSHYADHHRGVCLHFDTSQPPFQFAYKIDYSETYPEVVMPRTYQEPWDHVRKLILTKCIDWEYEDEYRLIDLPERAEDGPGTPRLFVEWDGPVAMAGQAAVTGITLGFRMDAANRKELLQYIDEARLSLEVFEADLHPSRYEVTRRRIRQR